MDLVQDMYNGVKAMIHKELELTPHSERPFLVGPHLNSHEDLKGILVFPQGTKSLLQKHLTVDMWRELRDKHDKFGVSFKQIIFTGCKNPDSSIGVIAGSHDSYHTFAPLFDKIIEDYHGHKPEAKHASDMDYTKLECPPFDPEDD